MNPSDRKKQLRENFLNQRRKLSVQEWKDRSEVVINRVLECLEQVKQSDPNRYSKPLQIHCYLSIERNREVRTDELIKRLQLQGYQVGCPKTDWKTTSMKTIALSPQTEIQEVQMGLREPKEGKELPTELLDIMIVPSVALDSLGGRIGYGKGYYDRALAELPKEKRPITLAPAFELSLSEDPFPLEETDIKVDWIVTEKRLLNCSL